jgi:hypothetical protein
MTPEEIKAFNETYEFNLDELLANIEGSGERNPNRRRVP